MGRFYRPGEGGGVSATLSNFLRTELQDRGLTLTELATVSGIPKQTLSNIINDPGNTADLATLVRIARGLQMPLWKILEIDGYEVGQPATPDEDVLRLARLIMVFPWVLPVVEKILNLAPDDKVGVVAFLEALERQRNQTG